MWAEKMVAAIQDPGRTFRGQKVCAYPDEAPASREPHVVWTMDGETGINAFEGYMPGNVAVSLDFRAMTREEVMALREHVMAELHRRRIVVRTGSVASLYDADTGIRRLIVDVAIDPYPSFQERSGDLPSRPWSRQWSRAFG